MLIKIGLHLGSLVYILRLACAVLLLPSYSLAVFFFFSSRRRHTRLQGDWSSDVCSSDLPRGGACGVCAACAGAVPCAPHRDQRRLRSIARSLMKKAANRPSVTPNIT